MPVIRLPPQGTINSCCPRQVKLKEVKQFMAQDEENTPEEVEHITLQPAPEGSELVEGPEGETPEEGETSEEPAETPGPKEQLVRRQPTSAPAEPAAAPASDSTERLPDEAPQTYALRMELMKTRSLLREQRGHELLGEPDTPAAAPVAKPVAPANEEILKKYKPEEIKAVEEVVKALGYVKSDQLQTQTYSEKGQAQLDAFLEKHPEYSPENDPKGDLWNAFKTEFSLYKQPADPKDFARIFNRVHATVFGIQQQAPSGKTAAATEKVNIASRGSAPAPSNTTVRTRVVGPGGIRTDMLKGFTPEELAEMGIE